MIGMDTNLLAYAHREDNAEGPLPITSPRFPPCGHMLQWR